MQTTIHSRTLNADVTFILKDHVIYIRLYNSDPADDMVMRSRFEPKEHYGNNEDKLRKKCVRWLKYFLWEDKNEKSMVRSPRPRGDMYY